MGQDHPHPPGCGLALASPGSQYGHDEALERIQVCFQSLPDLLADFRHQRKVLEGLCPQTVHDFFHLLCSGLQKQIDALGQ